MSEFRTVVVTGGTRGIGRSLCEEFVRHGWRVIVGARHDDKSGALAQEGVRFVAGDVRHESTHLGLVEEAIKWTGRLDAYINNAGYSEWRSLSEIDEAFFSDMISVNLKSAFFGCKAAASALLPGGTIINMSSLAGKRGTPNNSMYVATKFGMNGMTQALAKELGPRGIRVNAICPVLVRTPGLVSALEEVGSPAKGDPDRFLEEFAARDSALRRLPTGQEVASMALFLTSEGASAITGQCINVDCGVLPQ